MDQELKNSVLKTGTTILGIVCKDGVVMASDRQVTAGGRLVSDKNYVKTIKINDYLLAGLAGLVSDAQLVERLVRAELKLKELRAKSRPTVKQGANLLAKIVYQNIRKPSPIPGIVAILVGGVDEDGTATFYTVDPSGAMSEVKEYGADGSGALFVLGLLERQYKKDITLKQGVELAKEALMSSTQRDVYSGYGIDIFTISKEGIKKVVEQKIKSELRDQ